MISSPLPLSKVERGDGAAVWKTVLPSVLLRNVGLKKKST
jgi:hypothetical protein